MLASKLDLLPGYELPNDGNVHFPPNASKWLLWEDPIYSLYSAKSTELIDRHFSEVMLVKSFHRLISLASNVTR